MRAGSGLRVVLDGGALDVPEPQPLDGAVVEVDVGQLGGAEVGLPADRLVVVDRLRAVRAEHGEPVVLARDLGPSGRQVLDRMVGAVVAERELVGLEADRAAQQLMAEADAVDGRFADELADGLDDVVERGRVAGAVGEEDRVGVVSEQLGRRRRARMQLDRRPALAEVADDRELDAGVDHRDPRARIACEFACGEFVGSRTTSSRVPTSRARSRPLIDGSAAISSRAWDSLSAAGNSPPRIAPSSRMWRTSARVSRSVIAGIPQSVSQESQPRSAPGASSRSTAARMIAARAWTRSDSIASALTP